MNSWSNIASSHVEGALLQCRKGEWSSDGKPIKTGRDGPYFVLLMTSAIVGEILFDDDGAKIDERVGRIEDGFTPAKQLEQGWSPSTQITCIGFSDDIRGQVFTFRGSSWGARFALNALAGTYCRLGQQMFPVVYLDVTKKTRSGNTVIDPLFVVVDQWLPREDFSTGAALPPPTPTPTPTMTVVKLEEKAIARYAKAAGVTPEEVKAKAAAVFDERKPPPSEILDDLDGDNIPF
jgi:hypothetical protein